MACFHPLAAIKHDSKYNKIAKDGHEYTPLFIGSSRHEFAPFVDEQTGEFNDAFRIPCGVCPGCRMDHSREWADRCTLEAMMYPADTCWFLTLTFDMDQIEDLRVFEKPDGSLVDGDTFTLKKDIITDFKKRLLRQYSYHFGHEGVRFYECGEYGSTNNRPHFHIILFNAPLKDIYQWSLHTVKDYKIPIFRSPFIEKQWKYGFVWIERFDWNNAAYVARYTMKKGGKPSKVVNDSYIENGLVPEFTNMSRRPGIGVPFFEKHKDKFYRPVYRPVYDEEYGDTGVQELTCLDFVMPAHGSQGAKVLKPPRLFDERFSKMLSDDFAEMNYALAEGCHDALDIKYELEEKILAFNRYKQGKKESAEAAKRVLLSRTDMDIWEYQDQVEAASNAAYRMLKRNL